MKPLPLTPELLAVARRVVWFKSPQEALADPVHFLAHVMTYGTIEDLKTLGGVVGLPEFRAALEQAPRGFSIPDPGPIGTSDAVASQRLPCPPAPYKPVSSPN
ncbi:hypothetical protein [Solidesulfovibrio sp.]